MYWTDANYIITHYSCYDPFNFYNGSPPPPPHNSAGQRQAGGKSQAYPTVNVRLQASPEELVEVHTLPLDMLKQATDDQLP